MGLILRNCAQIPPPDAFDDGKNKMTHYHPLPWAFFHQNYLRVNATQPLIVHNLGIKLVVYKYVERVKLKKL